MVKVFVTNALFFLLSGLLVIFAIRRIDTSDPKLLFRTAVQLVLLSFSKKQGFFFFFFVDRLLFQWRWLLQSL